MEKQAQTTRTTETNFEQLLAEAQKQIQNETAKKKMAFDFIISSGKLQEFKAYCLSTSNPQ